MNGSRDLPPALAEVRRAWIRAVTRTDLSGYTALVCEDVVWIPPAGPALQGRAEFRDWLAPFFEEYRYDFSVPDASIRLAGGWAVEKGEFRTVMTPRSGGDAMEHSGRFVVLWRKGKGPTWRIDRYVDLTGLARPEGGTGLASPED